MYGMPAVDVFGDVDGLFDVPSLGAKPPSAPSAAAGNNGPPPLLPQLAPLQARKGPPPPTTGSHVAIPPSGAYEQADVVPAPKKSKPARPGAEATAKDTRVAKPIASSTATAVAGVPSVIGTQSPLSGSTRSAPLPSAAGLAAKIRASKIRNEPEPEPATAPSEPATERAEAPTEPPVPATEPSEPATEPSEPATEPSEPEQAAASSTANASPTPTKSEADANLEPVVHTRSATAKRSLVEAPLRESASFAKPEAAGDDEEITFVASRLTTTGPEPFGSPPPRRSPLAPPPPSTSTDGSGIARVGVPYEAPALILKGDGAAESEFPTEPPASTSDGRADAAFGDAARGSDSDGTDPSPDESSAGAPHGQDEPAAPPRPARLPSPGARLPPASSQVAARIAAATHAQAEVSTNPVTAAPTLVSTQDTGLLIAGLADELIAEAEAEAAQTLEAKRAPAPIVPPRKLERSKIALYVLGAAAALSLIVAVLPSQDKRKPTPDPVEATDQTEATGPADPVDAPADPLALADPVEDPPPSMLAASGTETGGETGTGGETDTDGETDTGGDEPEPEPVPVQSSSKPTRPSKSTAPAPTPTPEPKSSPVKPAPTKPDASPTDDRDDKQLYAAAQSAYNSGKAAEAYKLAYASWRKKSKSKTAELMTLAACKMKDKGKASSSLSKVSLTRRNAIKKDCAKFGVSL